MPFIGTWMDLESVILSEVIQTERDKYCMTSLIVESKTIQMNLLTKQRYSENELMVARRKG